MIGEYVEKEEDNICFICGEKTNNHKKGCKEYRKYLIENIGTSLEAFIHANSEGLLPAPLWSVKRNKTDET